MQYVLLPQNYVRMVAFLRYCATLPCSWIWLPLVSFSACVVLKLCAGLLELLMYYLFFVVVVD
jgi:hypothetical protein